MKYTRSELRHACYRAKNNAVTEKNQELLDIVQPLLDESQNWQNFAVEWDLLTKYVGEDIEIVIIKPETDYDFIHETLLEVALLKRKGLDVEDFSDRQMNVYTTVDTLRLDDALMPWSGYNRLWGIEVEPELKQIRTKLSNISPSQIEVTDEMIEASKVLTDGAEYTGKDEIQPAILNLKPVEKAEVKKFEELMKQLPPVAVDLKPKRKKK